MTDEELCKDLRSTDHFNKVMSADSAADRIEALLLAQTALIESRDAIEQSWKLQKDRAFAAETALEEVMNIATLALGAVNEVQTYEQPDDPWAENALVMCELDVFDFDIASARAVLEKYRRQ